jgi:hypothetical protein
LAHIKASFFQSSSSFFLFFCEFANCQGPARLFPPLAKEHNGKFITAATNILAAGLTAHSLINGWIHGASKLQQALRQ